MDDEIKTALERVKYFFEHDYEDRGMVKWQGFYLSDHTEDVVQYTEKRLDRLSQKKMPTMSEQEISEVLFDAFAQQKEVFYQLNRTRNDGIVPPIMHGRVNGYVENEAYISGVVVNISDINWCSNQNNKHE